MEAIDATSFSSNGWKERVACLKGGSGTFKTIAGPTGTGFLAGCTFKDKPTGVSIVGNIVVSKIDTSTPVDGIVTFTHTFNFTGTIVCSALL